MEIKLTDFALRHFDSKFGGTKILDYTPEEFEKVIKKAIEEDDFILNCLDKGQPAPTTKGASSIYVHNGYAPFCRYLAIPNFTKARVGSLPITLENYQYIRSGYSARRTDELPIFSRWLELPLEAPRAEWLVLVLYSKEQLNKEVKEKYEKDSECRLTLFDAEYGIVAILGQLLDEPEPLKPETMIRNAGYNTKEYQEKALEKFRETWRNTEMVARKIVDYLPEALYDNDIKSILSLQGIMVGGSGVPFSKEEYLKSVEFWDKNCTVK